MAIETNIPGSAILLGVVVPLEREGHLSAVSLLEQVASQSGGVEQELLRSWGEKLGRYEQALAADPQRTNSVESYLQARLAQTVHDEIQNNFPLPGNNESPSYRALKKSLEAVWFEEAWLATKGERNGGKITAINSRLESLRNEAVAYMWIYKESYKTPVLPEQLLPVVLVRGHLGTPQDYVNAARHVNFQPGNPRHMTINQTELDLVEDRENRIRRNAEIESREAAKATENQNRAEKTQQLLKDARNYLLQLGIPQKIVNQMQENHLARGLVQLEDAGINPSDLVSEKQSVEALAVLGLERALIDINEQYRLQRPRRETFTQTPDEDMNIYFACGPIEDQTKIPKYKRVLQRPERIMLIPGALGVLLTSDETGKYNAVVLPPFEAQSRFATLAETGSKHGYVFHVFK